MPFDIHGGGTDLIFPHHENEIAQSEPLMPAHAHLASVWVHGAMLNFDGRKMSKSLGNFEPLNDLLARHDPLAIRLLFLQTGYRKPMNFTEDALAAAASGAARLRKAYDAARELAVPPSTEVRERFFAALDDDMNTAGALGALFEALPAVDAALLEEALDVLGVGAILTREAPALAEADVDPALVARVARLIDERNAARKARDFALADQLRKALSDEGIVLTDGKDGTTWTVAGA